MSSGPLVFYKIDQEGSRVCTSIYYLNKSNCLYYRVRVFSGAPISDAKSSCGCFKLRSFSDPTSLLGFMHRYGWELDKEASKDLADKLNSAIR